ncbi:MAG: hypothetical protein CK427_10400 [Leptospira sp.]|nr:MAG: hypothetical protein CK427_10400 [Leptospira sp.]
MQEKQNNKKKYLPKISIVIIGINVEKYIKDCLDSILNCNYPSSHLEIIYSDGGSKDKTLEIIKSYKQIKVINLKRDNPTPGNGRNEGAKQATGEFIQFMDADTILSADWFNLSLPYLKNSTQAIWGRRLERYPDKNIFHKIGNFEWAIMGDGSTGHQSGTARSFGGDVLMSKSAFHTSEGYDIDLVAGEDPDFSYRFRKAGFLIYRLNESMTLHDLNMNSFLQYWKRSMRSGHAYAEIAFRYMRSEEKLFLREFLRIFLGTIFIFGLFSISYFTPFSIPMMVLGLLIFLRPFARIFHLRKKTNSNWDFLLKYCSHLSFVIIPQFLGSIRFMITWFGYPKIKNSR